jgi:hypothetical protein
MLGRASGNASIASFILSNSSYYEYTPSSKKSYSFIPLWIMADDWAKCEKQGEKRAKNIVYSNFVYILFFLNTFFVMSYTILTSMFNFNRYKSLSRRWWHWPVDITPHNRHKLFFSASTPKNVSYKVVDVRGLYIYMICKLSIPWTGYEKIYNNIISAFKM